MNHYTYEIIARPADLGGGWRLRLLENGEEMGGGVFPIQDDPEAGVLWWNECSEQERTHWLMMAASARPADAYHAFLLAEEYAAAEAEGEAWMDSRPGL